MKKNLFTDSLKRGRYNNTEVYGNKSKKFKNNTTYVQNLVNICTFLMKLLIRLVLQSFLYIFFSKILKIERNPGSF